MLPFDAVLGEFLSSPFDVINQAQLSTREVNILSVA